MKFKATLSDHGVSLLERRFVPAFEKIGKTCHIYLTKEHLVMLHNVLNADGVQASAQFTKDAVFDDYRISSQNEDRIAFMVDLALLSRALKSGVSMDGEKLQVKLVKKRPSLTERPMPYLTFESKGYRSAVVQDVPISQPLNRVDVQELQTTLDRAQDLPRTLVQVPDLVQLQALVDRLKNVGDILEVGVTQYGDLHLHVSTTLVSLGTEYRKLRVIGAREEMMDAAAEEPALNSDLSPHVRLEQAIQKSEASSVQVSMKHFVRSLQCHLTKPDAAFCGITPNNSSFLMMFQYFVPGTRQTDSSTTLHYRLPVIDQSVP